MPTKWILDLEKAVREGKANRQKAVILALLGCTERQYREVKAVFSVQETDLHQPLAEPERYSEAATYNLCQRIDTYTQNPLRDYFMFEKNENGPQKYLSYLRSIGMPTSVVRRAKDKLFSVGELR